MPDFDNMGLIPDLTDEVESMPIGSSSNAMDLPFTSNQPRDHQPEPSSSTSLLQVTSTSAKQFGGTFDLLAPSEAMGKPSVGNRTPRRPARRLYEIVDDRETETEGSINQHVGVLESFDETDLVPLQSFETLAPPTRRTQLIRSSDHQSNQSQPSSLNSALGEGSSNQGLSSRRKELPLNDSSLVPIDSGRHLNNSPSYQDLFGRLSRTAIPPAIPSRAPRMVPIEATIEIPNGLPPPLVPTPVPFHRPTRHHLSSTSLSLNTPS
jgi:hypothetical protein